MMLRPPQWVLVHIRLGQIQIGLLAAQGDHGIDGGGPAGGEQAGERGHGDEDQRYDDDHERIARAAFDPAGDEAAQAEAEAERESHSIPIPTLVPAD